MDRLRKDLSLKGFANLVAKDLQKLRRMEESNSDGICRCISCGKRDHWKKMQGGHFIGGRSMSVLLVEDNIWPQCVSCNQHKHGNQVGFEQGLINQFGEVHGGQLVKHLKELRGKASTYTRESLADLRDTYRARIKIEQKRVGK
jgi:Bacteriophage Lambda NinG protein